MSEKIKAGSSGKERSNSDRHIVWQISVFVGLAVCLIAVMYMIGPEKETNDVTLKGEKEISFEDLDRNSDGCITKSEFVQINKKVEGVGRSSSAQEEPRPDEPKANNLTTLEAEDGEKYEVFQLDEIVYSSNMVKLQPEKRLKWMKQLPYKDGDIIVCSYAKTGTHWMTNILHFLLYDGDLSKISSISPYLLDIPLNDPSFLDSEKRILASHLQPHRLPDEHLAKGGKIILVFRNPKDTSVSHFHHFRNHKMLSKTKLSWDRFLTYWQDGKIPLGSYFDFYNSWQNEMERNGKINVLVVHYEDLHKDTIHELRRIESYLGLQLSDERLRQVKDKSMFQNLKADVDSGKVKTILKDENGKTFLYRKGIVGDWKNHFTIAQNTEFETVVSEKFKDSIFKYREWD